MKKFLSALLCLCCLSHTAYGQYTQKWQLGTDNNVMTEFEQEAAAADANYYFENGNYTSLSGVNWTAGQELLLDTSSTALGFPRGLTPGFTQINIYFQLTAAQVGANQPIRLTIDLTGLAAASTHNLDVRANGNAVAFGSILNVTGNALWVSETRAGTAGFVVGNNVLRLRRTGGNTGASWIQFDYLRLETDVSPQFINTFTRGDSLLRPGETTSLNWALFENAATVKITPGIPSGTETDVTALTTGGVGSIAVNPTSNTTYTLSATFNSVVQTRTVAVATTPYLAQVEIGGDDAVVTDFSPVANADDNYYLAGDYTSVGGPNQVTNELLNDDTAGNNPAIGFEQGMTDLDSEINVWFTALPLCTDPTTVLRISADINSVSGPSSNNDIEILVNGNLLRRQTGITAASLIRFNTTPTSAGILPGPNKMTIRRTGNSITSGVLLDYLWLEYLPGLPVAISGVTTDPILGTRTVRFTSTVAATYRVQRSLDAGGTWDTLALNFPLGGAKGTSEYYEDRQTPHSTPTPQYRILLE